MLYRVNGVLAAGLLVQCVVAAGAAEAPVVAHDRWAGQVLHIELPTTTPLVEYRASTVSPTLPNVSLSLSFMPRFECEPVLAVHFAAAEPADTANAAGESSPAAVTVSPGDQDKLVLYVDGQLVGFAAIRDTIDDEVVLTLNASADARRALRATIDTADNAQLRLADGDSVPFSLLGSQRTVEAMESACIDHEPLAASD